MNNTSLVKNPAIKEEKNPVIYYLSLVVIYSSLIYLIFFFEKTPAEGECGEIYDAMVNSHMTTSINWSTKAKKCHANGEFDALLKKTFTTYEVTGKAIKVNNVVMSLQGISAKKSVETFWRMPFTIPVINIAGAGQETSIRFGSTEDRDRAFDKLSAAISNN